MPTPPQTPQRLIRSQQKPRSRLPKSHDHLWPNNLDLPQQIRPARINLRRCRRRVPRRTNLQNIRDIHRLTRQPHRTDHPLKKLTRPPNKRPPRPVLVSPGRLTNKHQPRLSISLTKYNIRVALNKRPLRALPLVLHPQPLAASARSPVAAAPTSTRTAGTSVRRGTKSTPSKREVSTSCLSARVFSPTAVVRFRVIRIVVAHPRPARVLLHRAMTKRPRHKLTPARRVQLHMQRLRMIVHRVRAPLKKLSDLL